MIHDWSKQRFRASATGLLMTDPRSKSEMISETTKAYLIEVYINVMFGRRKEIISKAMQKGLMQEEDSLTLLSRVEKTLFVKNEENLTNDWLTGTPDIRHWDAEKKKIIRDTKTSWDIFTFWKAKTNGIDKGYYWQLQSYMDLDNAETSYLDYCLVNTPPALIESEKRKFLWNQGIVNSDDEISREAFETIERNCIFDDIPIEKRVHSLLINRNQEDINRLHERVVLCRNWMNANLNF
jgi:hypothetical protein